MASSNQIRSTFLEFFADRGHEIVASSPLVPRNDPTLMFTNAGMVQFKDYFTGKVRPPFPRAVTAQKVVRAGGKHNDLDNVGYTARHHTFFEMLGNFSFGDYFKEHAIELAWELVTKTYDISPERLLVTVYADDDVAFDLWRRIAGLGDDRIIRIATADNFWAMGEQGPCGPCSEIFFDHGPHLAGGPPGSPDEDGDRFVEIWNLVFMQYEQVAGGDRVDLPRPSIDTGLGLERVAAVLQGVHDNYDIDLFRHLIAASSDAFGVPADQEHKASHRVIADHLRSVSFLIADGVLPSNEGRGYVLRRIMRRAMRHGHLLGGNEPIIHTLVPSLVAEMGQAYPELERAKPLIVETLRLEEERFQRTLSRGLSLLEDATASMDQGGTLDGETAFKLYDTYGFPIDLTQDALRARGLNVDLTGFGEAMERQRAEARAHWSGSGEEETETIWLTLGERLGATEFLGYDTGEAEGVVQAVVRDGAEVDRLEAGQAGLLIVNQTPFYAESGGQVGDTGVIEAGGARFLVDDTRRKADGLIVHQGRVEEGTFAVNMAVSLRIDDDRRTAIRGNHSATHLVHEALRQVLGDHVAQKGSLVAPDRLRFDFAHPKPLTEEELERVEAIANAIILQNATVETRLMDTESAIKSGARALFGEKYGDEVRVVSMGRNGAAAGSSAYSIELCGGTHVRQTGQIGLIAVVGETAVGAGVRRLEALTGDAARRYLSAQDRRVREIAALLRIRPEQTVERVEALSEERRRLERELADAKRKLALGGSSEQGEAPREVAGVTYLGRVLQGVPGRELKGLVDDAKRQIGSGVVAYVGVDGGKAGIVVGVTDDLTPRFDAVELVKAGAAALGGKGGGGRSDMAQAGGPDIAKGEDALDAVAKHLAGVPA